MAEAAALVSGGTGGVERALSGATGGTQEEKCRGNDSKGGTLVYTHTTPGDQNGNPSLMLRAQPEGGYTVTSPVLPELITEGDTVEAALAHVPDALAAVIELYEDLGKPLPDSIVGDPERITFEYPVSIA